MSNKPRIYSADDLPQFSRWQPRDIEEPESVAPAEALIESEPASWPEAEAEVPETVEFPTADQLTALSQQAYDEGWKAGHAEGLAAAHAAAQPQIAAIATLQSALEQEIGQLKQQLAQQILDLTLDITGHLLRSELAAKPQHILPLVQEAMQALPLPHPHPRLHLHPDDLALVRDQFSHELESGGWKLIEDSEISRGGCLIETTNSQLDARLETRWRELVLTLGQPAKKLPHANR